MGRDDLAGENEDHQETFTQFLARIARRGRPITLRLSRVEAEILLDALEAWAEGYKSEAWNADDEIVASMYESMAIATEIRFKLWKKWK
jgi:hypothetical protein